ncbi:iron-siderophore ABC transporter substrate-binding protein [Vibrio owensii]
MSNFTAVVIISIISQMLSIQLAYASGLNASVVDDLDHTISTSNVTHFPRVASVSTFGAELVIAMGEKPVGVSDYPGGFPPYLSALNDVPSLGNRSRTSFEALYDVKPDLVVGLGRMLEPYYQRFVEIAPPLGFDLITLEDSFSAVERASMVMGREEQGKSLNMCFQAFLDEMQSKLGNRQFSGLFLTSAGVTPRAYYSHFMSVALMEKLNIRSANGDSPYATKTPFSGQVGLEWLVKLDPDVIFMYQNAEPQFTESKIWQSLKAVKNNRVYLVDMTWREPEGPLSRIWVAMDIAHKVYPELFPAPSVERVYEVINGSCS